MPKDNSENGFAPILLIIALFAGLAATGTAASQIPQTTDYPIVQSAGVLGDYSAEKELSDEEYMKLKELKMEEMKLKEELKKKEMALREEEHKKKKEELKKKEERAKLELERKRELIKKQNELRKLAKENRASAEAELEESELEDLEKKLKLLELELNSSPNDGKVVYEQTVGDLKIRYKYENGKLAVKAQAENGAEIEVDDPQVQAVKEQLEKTLRSNGGAAVATQSGKVLLGKNKIKAWANGVITVDPLTGQMTINTPKGQKQVAVLPDQAVNNLYTKQVLSEVEYEAELQDGQNGDSIIELQNKNDQVVYKVKGKKTNRILGLLPVKTDTTAFVSAENGELVSKEESMLAKFIALISF